MKIPPKIRTLDEKLFTGRKIEMSYAINKTTELWRSFMPSLKKIKNRLGVEFYSIEIYPTGFFKAINPETPFEKWAAVEISSNENIPEDFETIISPEGLYAVFTYKGTAVDAFSFYHYIFKTWLPKSEYILDDRPHFAIMGEKYKNNDPESEEEICIPVRSKTN